MRKIAALVAALCLLGANLAFGSYAPNVYPVFDALAFGAVGDGALHNNNVTVQALFTAAASGGHIRFPCGVFKVSISPTVNIAASAAVTLEGAGNDCTTLLVSGANGPVFNYLGIYSSANVRAITIATDTAGGFTGLTETLAVANNNPAFSGQNAISDVVVRGDDAYGANTHYWATGVSFTGIANVSVLNFGYVGVPRVGVGFSFVGNASAHTYGGVFNFVNATFNSCLTAVVYGDWIQGIAMTALNATNCQNGIVTAASPAGELTELTVTNSQFNTFICGICINDAQFGVLALQNNVFIIEPNSTGIQVQGTQYFIIGNDISAVNNTGTIGVNYPSGFAQGGITSNNMFVDLAVGVQVAAGAACECSISGNRFSGNTLDYSVGAGAADVVINDTIPRNFATLIACTTPIRYSRFLVADSNTSVFYATIAGGSNNVVNAVCDGTRWAVH